MEPKLRIELIAAANKYLIQGFNVMVIKEDKTPLHPWLYLQTEFNTLDNIIRELQEPKAYGIAIVCGAISKDLTVVKIDFKDLSGEERAQRYMELCEQINEDEADRVLVVGTPTRGFHWYYWSRFGVPEITDPLLQVIGEGGYVVAPPTPGYSLLFNWGASGNTPEEDRYDSWGLHTHIHLFKQLGCTFKGYSHSGIIHLWASPGQSEADISFCEENATVQIYSDNMAPLKKGETYLLSDARNRMLYRGKFELGRFKLREKIKD